MSLLGLSSLGFPFALADLGCLLLIYEVLDDAVEVRIPSSQEQNIVSSDGCPACMATEALQIYGNVLWFASQILWLLKKCNNLSVLTDLSPDHFCQSSNKLRRGIPIAPQRLFVHHFADCKP